MADRTVSVMLRGNVTAAAYLYARLGSKGP